MSRVQLMSRAGVGAFIVLVLACAGSEPKPKSAQESKRATGLNQDDASRCDYIGRSDREVRETTGPGAIQPNIRRVFGIIGEGESRRRVLLCREVDTNLDGSKDVVRTYNDEGERRNELADSDYDGRIDTWIVFEAGRIARVGLDKNADGKRDETRFYIQGRLSRIERDTNADEKPDVWEVYRRGQLQRMGVDLDHDGRVDRWDRDATVGDEDADEANTPQAADGGTDSPPQPSRAQPAQDGGAGAVKAVEPG